MYDSSFVLAITVIMPSFPPSSSHLSEKVASILREAIAKGELVPGERLPEKLFSEQMGVSRAPIRDAFRILELEGLVQIIPQKGARIKGLTVKDVESIYEWRDP